MTVPRFFIPKEHIDNHQGKVLYQNSELCKQISKVLRFRQGEALDILDGEGRLYHCHLDNLAQGQLTASIDECIQLKLNELNLIHVGLPLLKSGRFEWALEKLTELGVAKITPLHLKRSVVTAELADKTGEGNRIEGKLGRWRTILKESSEQCERATIPLLVSPSSFEHFVQTGLNSKKRLVKIICAERSSARRIDQILDNHNVGQSLDEVVITVGAEGGFTASELDYAIAAGFHAASLGERILRSETAAIYALSIVASQLASKA